MGMNCSTKWKLSIQLESSPGKGMVMNSMYCQDDISCVLHLILEIFIQRHGYGQVEVS